MRKWIITIMLILCLPVVMGASVEISTDNATWTSVDDVEYNGKIGTRIASANNLEQDTLYYFRVREGAGNWSYLEQRTEEGGINQVELGIVLALLFVIGLCAYLMNKLEDGFKLPLLVGIMISTSFLFNVVANLADSAEVSATVVSLLWFGYRLSLTLLFAIILYAGWALMVQLKIRKTPPPDIGNPLYHAKKTRKETGKYR